MVSHGPAAESGLRRHNGALMRKLLVLAILAGFGALSQAQVIRCADAAGQVSYTDDRTCPAGARQTGQVLGPEATERRPEPPDQRGPAPPIGGGQRESSDTAALPPPPPGSGLTVIDPRAGTPAGDPRVSDRRVGDGGEVVIDDGSYGYPYPGSYSRPRPPRDMRPPLRGCDASGCRDTLGNQYDRAGRLTGYQRPDGSTCRQVGTTQVCR